MLNSLPIVAVMLVTAAAKGAALPSADSARGQRIFSDQSCIQWQHQWRRGKDRPRSGQAHRPQLHAGIAGEHCAKRATTPPALARLVSGLWCSKYAHIATRYRQDSAVRKIRHLGRGFARMPRLLPAKIYLLM
jgi:hypothetical protein